MFYDIHAPHTTSIPTDWFQYSSQPTPSDGFRPYEHGLDSHMSASTTTAFPTGPKSNNEEVTEEVVEKGGYDTTTVTNADDDDGKMIHISEALIPYNEEVSRATP